jgi:hypothetical protein
VTEEVRSAPSAHQPAQVHPSTAVGNMSDALGFGALVVACLGVAVGILVSIQTEYRPDAYGTLHEVHPNIGLGVGIGVVLLVLAALCYWASCVGTLLARAHAPAVR